MCYIWTFHVRRSHSGGLLGLASCAELVFSVASMFEDMSVLCYFFFRTIFHHRGTPLHIYPFTCGQTLSFWTLGLSWIMLLCKCVYRFLGKCFQFWRLGVGALGHAVTPHLTSLGTCQGFSKVTAPFYVPTLGGRGSTFSFLIGACNSVCGSSRPSGCEVVSQWSELHFPDDQWYWTSFYVLI